LAPIAIDADQFLPFAHLVLGAAGIVVGERDDG